MQHVMLSAPLRAFVALAEHGTLALAGQATHRSASAISLQIASLEHRVGRQLFVRGARGMALTPAGSVLLGHARALMTAEQSALEALATLGLAGTVRFGMPQDFASSRLAATLASFRRAHAAVNVTAVVERNNVIASMMARSELDLALLIGRRAQPHAIESVRQPTIWHAADGFVWRKSTPLPLVLLESPCIYREDAMRALERAGIPHALQFTTGSVSGMWAAVQAGVGVTARMAWAAPPGVSDFSAQIASARLPATTLSLVRAGYAHDEVVTALSQRVAAALRD